MGALLENARLPSLAAPTGATGLATRFLDTQLRPGMHYDEKWQYVRQNPVRAGLAADSDAWPHQGELNELRW
jgi:hypothetical protein